MIFKIPLCSELISMGYLKCKVNVINLKIWKNLKETSIMKSRRFYIKFFKLLCRILSRTWKSVLLKNVALEGWVKGPTTHYSIKLETNVKNFNRLSWDENEERTMAKKSSRIHTTKYKKERKIKNIEGMKSSSKRLSRLIRAANEMRDTVKEALGPPLYKYI